MLNNQDISCSYINQDYYQFDDDNLFSNLNDRSLINENNNYFDYRDINYYYDTGSSSNQVSEFSSELNPKNENDKNVNDVLISDNVEIQNNDISQNKSKEIKTIDNLPKTKSLTRRKRMNSDENRTHSKYCEDNILRKIEVTLLNIILEFINDKINKIYNGNIGQGIIKKELLRIDQSQIKNAKQSKELLYKKLKDIFSFNISKRYTYYMKDHNKNIIKNLLNEKDTEKKLILEKIFNLTFLDCLYHIRGSINIDILDGLKTIDDICIKFEDDNDYIELMKFSINNMEKIILRRKSRNRIKKD